MDLAFHAVVEHLVHLRLRLVVKIGMPQYNHVEGVQGGLDVGVVGIQEGGGLSATAHGLNPEEIRHRPFTSPRHYSPPVSIPDRQGLSNPLARPTAAIRPSSCETAAFDEAKETPLECYEGEARRRAVEGVEEYVLYRGEPILINPKTGRIDKDQGVPVVRRRYSDVLLIVLLKSLAPEKYRDFRDVVDQRTTGDADLGEVRLKEFLRAHSGNGKPKQ